MTNPVWLSSPLVVSLLRNSRHSPFMRSLLSIILCLVTVLASTPVLAAGTEHEMGASVDSCGCHMKCCCASASDQPVKQAPAVPVSKSASDGWQYQAEEVVFVSIAAPVAVKSIELPMTEASPLGRVHAMPLFVRHCCPLL